MFTNPKQFAQEENSENHKLPYSKDGFQTYFSRTPLLMVMDISMDLVDPLALDPT